MASSRCLTSAFLPIESAIKRTLCLFDEGRRSIEGVAGVDGFEEC